MALSKRTVRQRRISGQGDGKPRLRPHPRSTSAHGDVNDVKVNSEMMTNRTSSDCSPGDRRLSSDTAASSSAALPRAEDDRRNELLPAAGSGSSCSGSPVNELRAVTTDALTSVAAPHVDTRRQLIAEGEDKAPMLSTSSLAAPIVHDSVIARLLLDSRRPVFTGKAQRNQQQRKLKGPQQALSTAAGGGIGDQPSTNGSMALAATSADRDLGLGNVIICSSSSRYQQVVDISAANVATSFPKMAASASVAKIWSPESIGHDATVVGSNSSLSPCLPHLSIVGRHLLPPSCGISSTGAITAALASTPVSLAANAADSDGMSTDLRELLLRQRDVMPVKGVSAATVAAVSATLRGDVVSKELQTPRRPRSVTAGDPKPDGGPVCLDQSYHRVATTGDELVGKSSLIKSSQHQLTTFKTTANAHKDQPKPTSQNLSYETSVKGIKLEPMDETGRPEKVNSEASFHYRRDNGDQHLLTDFATGDRGTPQTKAAVRLAAEQFTNNCKSPPTDSFSSRADIGATVSVVRKQTYGDERYLDSAPQLGVAGSRFKTKPDNDQPPNVIPFDDGANFFAGKQLDAKPAHGNLPAVIYGYSHYDSTQLDVRNLTPKTDLSPRCSSTLPRESETDRKCQDVDSVKKTVPADDTALDQHLCQPPRKRFRYDKSLADYVTKNDAVDDLQRRESTFSPGPVRSLVTSKVESLPMSTGSVLAMMESQLKKISDFSTKTFVSTDDDDCPIDYCRVKKTAYASSNATFTNGHSVKGSSATTPQTNGDAEKINYVGSADGVAAAGPPPPHASCTAANVQDDLNPHGTVVGGRGMWCRPCGIWFSDEVLHSIHAGCHAVASTDGGGSDLFSCNVCGRKCADRYAFNTHLVRGHVVLDASVCTTPNQSIAAVDRQVFSSCSSSSSTLDESRCRYLQTPPSQQQQQQLQQHRTHKLKSTPSAAAAAAAATAALEWQMTFLHQQWINSRINPDDHCPSGLGVTPAYCGQDMRVTLPSDAAAADWSSSSTAFRKYRRRHVTEINRAD